MFIIGSLAGECRQEILPLREDAEEVPGVYGEEKVARALRARDYKGCPSPKYHYDKAEFNLVKQEKVCQRIPLKFLSRNQKKIEGDYAYTIDGANTGGVNDGQLRRLTPIECERLQGFPDNWTAKGIDEKGNLVKISDTQRYKQMGNAVTTNVIEAIVKNIN